MLIATLPSCARRTARECRSRPEGAGVDARAASAVSPAPLHGAAISAPTGHRHRAAGAEPACRFPAPACRFPAPARPASRHIHFLKPTKMENSS